MNRYNRRMTMLKPSHYRRLRGERLVSRGTVLTLAAAAAVGALIGVAPALDGAAPADVSLVRGGAAGEPGTTTYSEPLSGCTATDGDTIRCRGERIRLLGVDSAELPGHCRSGRDCAPGDPYEATRSLEAAMSGALTIDRVGTDHYGRTLARVAGSRGDLSCWQLARGQAVYKPRWDNGLRVARTCPVAAAGGTR